MDDSAAVQRELGKLGEKIDALSVIVGYRFDDLSRRLDQVKSESDHDFRNVRTTIVALSDRVDRKVVEEPQWTHMHEQIDKLKAARNYLSGAIAVIAVVVTILGAGLSAWIGNLPHPEQPKSQVSQGKVS